MYNIRTQTYKGEGEGDETYKEEGEGDEDVERNMVRSKRARLDAGELN